MASGAATASQRLYTTDRKCLKRPLATKSAITITLSRLLLDAISLSQVAVYQHDGVNQ